MRWHGALRTRRRRHLAELERGSLAARRVVVLAGGLTSLASLSSVFRCVFHHRPREGPDLGVWRNQPSAKQAAELETSPRMPALGPDAVCVRTRCSLCRRASRGMLVARARMGAAWGRWGSVIIRGRKKRPGKRRMRAGSYGHSSIWCLSTATTWGRRARTALGAPCVAARACACARA